MRQFDFEVEADGERNEDVHGSFAGR